MQRGHGSIRDERFSVLAKWGTWTVLLLICPHGLGAGTGTGFADRLFAEEDYLRAIGEYKRMSFFTADPDSSLYFQYRIGECYRHMGDLESAKSWYDKVLLKGGDNSDLERRAVTGAAICLINRNDTGYARMVLHDYRADSTQYDSVSFLLGVSYLKERRWNEAEDAFAKIASAELAKSARGMLEDASSKRLKSPRTALLLSIFIPGAGQVYAARPGKGVVSFSLNLTLGYLTYKAFHEKRNLDGFLILYFGLQRFYFGNLEQARRYTDEYNRNLRDRINVD